MFRIGLRFSEILDIETTTNKVNKQYGQLNLLIEAEISQGFISKV